MTSIFLGGVEPAARVNLFIYIPTTSRCSSGGTTMASAFTTPSDLPVIPSEQLTKLNEYPVAFGGYGQVFRCIMRSPAAPEALVGSLPFSAVFAFTYRRWLSRSSCVLLVMLPSLRLIKFLFHVQNCLINAYYSMRVAR